MATQREESNRSLVFHVQNSRRRRRTHLAIINDPVEEGPCSEVLQGGGGWPVVQQVLGGEQHQGLLEGSVQLAPESMEHLRWCCGIDHKDVGQALSMPPHVLHHHLLPHILQRHSTAVIVTLIFVITNTLLFCCYCIGHYFRKVARQASKTFLSFDLMWAYGSSLGWDQV